MQLSEAFVSLGEDVFTDLIRHISIGKLRTYHLAKLNTESLRKVTPRFWARLQEGDAEFARDLAQSILVGYLDMIREVLDFMGIPNQDGFFEKNLDASKYLSEGWQARVWERFHGKFPDPVLRLYINHLTWELAQDQAMFVP